MPTSPVSQVEETLAALRRSQDRLAKLLEPMAADDLAGGSYASDWSIAQVASHLGSGAEIFGLIVDAGLRGAAAPGQEAFAGVWARWNAKDPAAQGRDALESIGSFVAGVKSLTAEQREQWQIDVFGEHFELAELLVMRLAEQVLHCWDIAVMGDSDTVLPDDEACLVIDNLAHVASRSGRAVAQPPLVRVVTTEPQRSFDLTLDGEKPDLVPATKPAPAGAAQLTTPAEAFIRLIYGRLDSDHTPDSVHGDGVDVDTLRAAFPGP